MTSAGGREHACEKDTVTNGYMLYLLPRSSSLWAAQHKSCSCSRTTPCRVRQSCSGWSGVASPGLTDGSWSDPTVHLMDEQVWLRVDWSGWNASTGIIVKLTFLTYASVENC